MTAVLVLAAWVVGGPALAFGFARALRVRDERRRP